ncbi:MAG: hypothetical protein Q4B60_07635 [Erysipelotrichaceae bacterium]|nr:hypothetical protein [Erysipelotrichaceae bacterium]
MALLDEIQKAGMDLVKDKIGDVDVTKLVKTLETTIVKDLGLSADLKKQIKEVVNNDVAKKAVTALLKKYVANPNKTLEMITDFVNKL